MKSYMYLVFYFLFGNKLCLGRNRTSYYSVLLSIRGWQDGQFTSLGKIQFILRTIVMREKVLCICSLQKH